MLLHLYIYIKLSVFHCVNMCILFKVSSDCDSSYLVLFARFLKHFLKSFILNVSFSTEAFAMFCRILRLCPKDVIFCVIETFFYSWYIIVNANSQSAP